MQADIHFNSLPKSVRERVIAATRDQGSPVPILADRPSAGGMTAIAACTVAVVAFGVHWLWTHDFGAPYKEPYEIPGLVAFATLVAIAGWAVFTAIHRQIVKAKLPFAPGVYLIGGDLIDARSSTLRVVPLVDCRPAIVHHHYNGAYVRTAFSFTPPIGKSFEFSVKPRHVAESVLDEIEKTVRLVGMVQAIGDRDVLAKLDLFHDLRDGDGHLAVPGRAPDPVPPIAGDIPRWIGRPTLLALASAALLGPGIWYLRNNAHDDAAFEAAKGARDSYGLTAYLRWGTRHADEARALMLPKKLEEAKQQHTVTAIRDFLHSYPDAPEALREDARAAIHEHFASALARFKEIASQDTETIEFVERLIAFEEAHDSPGLRVEFRPPQTASLAEMDEMLKTFSEGKYDFAPLATHFTDDTAGRRESEIVSMLTQGFSQVFSEDVLHLENGGRIAGDLGGATDRATIDVSYEVRPMMDEEDGPVIYLLDEPGYLPPGLDPSATDDLPTNKRLYLGIEVSFSVTMRVPGHEETRQLTLLVQPPERFTVSNDSYGDPTDSSVYSIMTSRAFDQLSQQLGSAFFEKPLDAAPPPAYVE